MITKEQKHKIECAEMDFYTLPPAAQKQAAKEFSAQFEKNPDLPFYGLLFKNNRPRIIVIKGYRRLAKKHLYTAYICKEGLI